MRTRACPGTTGRHGMRHGGKILSSQLEAQGATAAFTVPGESFLAALDGLHDSNRIKTIICRQEGGAAMMAEAWGKITGEPGVCFVTRGPGRGQRHERAACGAAGFHADGAVRRHAGARARGSRGVPGDRGEATVLLVREMGRGDPADRTHPRVREPRFPRGALGASGPRGARSAGGHAVRNRGGDRCQAGSCCIARREFAATSSCCRTGWQKRRDP